MSHRRDKIRRKLSASWANEETGMFRHSAVTGFVGLTFAILHATAVADDARPQSEPHVDVSFVLQQLSADEYSSALPALSPHELDLLRSGEPVIKVPEELEADALVDGHGRGERAAC
jgi:hypothetical protein